MNRTVRLVLGAGLALGVGVLAGVSPAIVREGDGEHREKMSELESKPFPAGTLAGLTEWIGGDPLTAEAFTAGDVVVFAFVDANNAAAMTAMNTLTRLGRTRADAGLKVFAVHGEDGWDAMQALADANRVRIPVAKDAGGAFRAAMGADDTPDLYVVDRAGNLRYADFETRALELAVTRLLRESVEQAAANAELEAKTRTALMTERPTRTASKSDKPAKKATPEQYQAARWPTHNSGDMPAKNVQGQPLPVPLGSETWLTPKQDLTGKVIVLDFWATWCGPCIRAMPTLDELQRTHGDKIAVLGVAGQSRGTSYPEDAAAIRRFMANSRHEYGQLIDEQQRVYRSLEIRAIPHAVVLSSDGVVRWQGNPLSPAFRQAVEQVLKVDPGL